MDVERSEMNCQGDSGRQLELVENDHQKGDIVPTPQGANEKDIVCDSAVPLLYLFVNNYLPCQTHP